MTAHATTSILSSAARLALAAGSLHFDFREEEAPWSLESSNERM